jgi:hypothetical protein
VEKTLGPVVHRLRHHLLSLLLLLLTAGAAAAQTKDSAKGYLYIEPYVGRFEFIVDLPTALGWLRQEHDPLQVVSTADQERYRSELMRGAGAWCSVEQDDTSVASELKGVTFLKGSGPNVMTMTSDDKLEAPMVRVGLTWEIALSGSPTRVELRWKQFPTGVTQLPVAIYSGSGSAEQVVMNQPLGNARWVSKGATLKPRAASKVPAAVMPTFFHLPVAMILWVTLGLAVWVWVLVKGLKFPGGITPFLAAWMIGVIVTAQAGYLPIRIGQSEEGTIVSTARDGEQVVQPLLENIYRAFDYRTDAEVSDLLKYSLAEPLVADLLKSTNELLVLEGNDGTRARVTKVGHSLLSYTQQGEGFSADAEWTVLAKAQHWGHPDGRSFRVKAKLTLQPEAGQWRITGLEVANARKS